MSSVQIKYPDGTEAKIGDAVLLAHGAHTGTVQDVVDTVEKQNLWGLSEFGLMIDTSYAGLTFEPVDAIVEGEIELVQKKPA